MIEEIKVLDKGYVALLDSMGNDSTIVNAARICKGGEGPTKNDAKFIANMWRMKHTSPFEQVVFSFKIKCPIFVSRQIIRHRTARINEVSLCFTKSKLEFYMPADERLGTHPVEALEGMQGLCDRASALYLELLDNHVPKEVARGVLPVSLYTEFFWQMDLHNLMHFLTVRAENIAQWEIVQYAKAIKQLVTKVCPLAMAALG